ncbi:MAG: aldehyde ferredoxin oxidoreductase N-terminal domain-containing protein, partial [Thermoplasmata archaeon]
MYGWNGKVLRINLTNMEYRAENIEEKILKEYIGGRGLGAKILYDEVKPDVDPLSEQNKLIFSVGPLTGTAAPTAGRYSVTAKSPLTGTIFDANSGGHFGVEIKRAGYDAIIVEGCAEKLTYVFIKNEEVVFGDATALSGMDTYKTTEQILASTDRNAKVGCIGPAGEKLLLISCIINDRNRAAGRG